MALEHHRFEWLYVTAFVSPRSGETFWHLSNGVYKPFYEALLALFASEAGAGDERFIILVIDGRRLARRDATAAEQLAHSHAE